MGYHSYRFQDSPFRTEHRDHAGDHHPDIYSSSVCNNDSYRQAPPPPADDRPRAALVSPAGAGQSRRILSYPADRIQPPAGPGGTAYQHDMAHHSCLLFHTAAGATHTCPQFPRTRNQPRRGIYNIITGCPAQPGQVRHPGRHPGTHQQRPLGSLFRP
ncbi:MAG: hypothetical protein BWY89_00556 [Bacteroidetes bacterium ADurb.BinA012]|nr:MAG: hypothetical protein BWY89_00556 [Bacteroidetes bacterium ADurb.BinA012]